MMSKLDSSSLVVAPVAERFFSLDQAAADFLVAAERGYDPLLTEVEQVFCAATGARRAIVLLRTADAWRTREDLRRLDVADDASRHLGDDVLLSTACVRVPNGLFAPIRSGEVAVLVEGAPLHGDALDVAKSLARIAELALTLCERSETAGRALDEIHVLQHLSARIMKSHDLEEILLRITHEAQRLLGADISGIMLRERDQAEIVMRRCVGNHAAETAALRFKPGQGVAGRVLATREPCCVGDYLHSNDAISTDFFHLARAEKVRSALATPILAQGEIIGVLEVWRRRPSMFTAEDTQRLAALASLTSIAIENARLYNTLETTVSELENANALLATRYATIRSSSAFQQDLMQLLLEERSLQSLVAKAAAHARCDALVLDDRFAVEAGTTSNVAAVRTAISVLVATGSRVVSDTMVGPSADKVVMVQAVAAGAERFGWVAFIVEGPADEGRELAIRQLAIAVALYYAEQRAGSVARAETLEALTWDVLEGKEEVRRAGLSRAREMSLPLDQPLRVAFCSVPGAAGGVGDGVADLELRRRRVREICMSADATGGNVVSCSMRGDRVAILFGGIDAAEADRIGQRLVARLARDFPGAAIAIGVSGLCAQAMSLPTAAREARIALEVAVRRHPVRVAVYEEVGIVGLLLSLREDADLSRLVDTTLGNLLGLAPQIRDPLVETLRTFFETNCSQQATARCLGIHHKTVSYRLTKLTELTGLDFTSHEDRLLADIALRLVELMGPPAAHR